MYGILVDLDRRNNWGKVDTRNKHCGVLTIYFRHIPEDVTEGCTVEFELVTSRTDNIYAKFIAVPPSNQTIFNTEDRDSWYILGEKFEKDFIEHIVPRLNIDIRKNPEKNDTCPWVIDLYDYTNDRPADLKTQDTPFFEAGMYNYGGKPYNNQYTVTFNQKDYENYLREYPLCDIYFWIRWTQLTYRNMSVQEMHGVWRAPFSKMAEKIQANEVVLHQYHNRKDDDYNAKASYLFDLSDENVFERLL